MVYRPISFDIGQCPYSAEIKLAPNYVVTLNYDSHLSGIYILTPSYKTPYIEL